MCHRCGRKGHIAPVCRSSHQNVNPTSTSKKPVNRVDGDTVGVFTLGNHMSPPMGGLNC